MKLSDIFYVVSKSYSYSLMMRSMGMLPADSQMYKNCISIFKSNYLIPFFSGCFGIFKKNPLSTPKKILLLSPAEAESISSAITSVFDKSPQLRAAMSGKNAKSIMLWNENLRKISKSLFQSIDA